MANSVPTLSNMNYHMFEPSPIETSLVANVDNPMAPSARANLFRYQTQNELNGQNYQHRIDDMHATQVAEAIMAQKNARMNTMLTGLKDAGQTPGMTQAMMTGGMVPEGMDVSGVGVGADAKAAALNMHNVGTGVGAAAQGGITGLTPAVQAGFGPTAGQTLSPAMVQTAQVKERGANARHGSGAGTVGITLPVGSPGPNQATARIKLPAHMVPGLPSWAGGSNISADDGGGDTTSAPMSALPPAPTDTGSGPGTSDRAAIMRDISRSKVPPQPTADGKGTIHTGESGKQYLIRNK